MIGDIGRFHLLIVVTYQWPGPPTKEKLDLANPMEQATHIATTERPLAS